MTDAGAGRMRPGRRFEALDGLRGVAAVIVVLCHAMLIVPSISAAIVDGVEPQTGTLEWWLLRTPLRVLTMGGEAVLVFFILSGFVLTLGFMGRRMTPRFVGAYLVRRVLRLYIPVWGSLALALGLATLVARDPDAASSWLASHGDTSVGVALRDAVLLLGTSNLNSPLWSLIWEVWFSLLLPVIYVVFRAIRIERWWYIAAPALIALGASAHFEAVRDLLPMAHVTTGLLRYMPVFCLGVLFALRHEDVARAYSRAAPAVRTSLWVAVLVLLTVPLLAEPFGASPLERGSFGSLSLIGSVGLVMLVTVSARATTFFASRPVLFFGTRSFSLYLVHEPIIVAAALFLGAASWLPWVAVLPIVLGVTVVVAMVFYRLVEVPSMTASRAAGRFLDGSRTRPPAERVPTA